MLGRRVLAKCLVAMLSALTAVVAGFTASPAANAAPPTTFHAHTHNGQCHAVPPTYTTTERSPPAIAYDHTKPFAAVDAASFGRLARPRPAWSVTCTDYGPCLQLVQTTSGPGATRTAPASRVADVRAVLGASVAANAGRGALNLPFRDPALRSQVDDVVRHFDEFGTPPTGVAQGGLKGHPIGTYGNKNEALPGQPLGYYTETDIWTSGGNVKRGAERLILGRNGEVYYTSNHYELGSFVRIR